MRIPIRERAEMILKLTNNVKKIKIGIDKPHPR